MKAFLISLAFLLLCIQAVSAKQTSSIVKMVSYERVHPITEYPSYHKKCVAETDKCYCFKKYPGTGEETFKDIACSHYEEIVRRMLIFKVED